MKLLVPVKRVIDYNVKVRHENWSTIGHAREEK